MTLLSRPIFDTEAKQQTHLNNDNEKTNKQTNNRQPIAEGTAYVGYKTEKTKLDLRWKLTPCKKHPKYWKAPCKLLRVRVEGMDCHIEL